MVAELAESICFELPVKVVNVSNAIDAVGGAPEISRFASDATFMKEPEGLELRLRNDKFHHPIKSMPVRTKNIVIQVSIPYRYRLNNSLQKSLSFAEASDAGTTIVRPKYVVNHTHRFREMADFQYYTGDSKFALEMKRSVFAGNLDQIMRINLGLNSTNTPSINNDLLPPVKFSVNTQPFYYAYQQSPYVKLVDDASGERKLMNTAASSKVISNLLSWGDQVPTSPPSALSSQPKTSVQECIDALRQLFAERPSYTRRALQHKLGSVLSRQLKFSLPYVSYYYRSGPWRGAYIKYGVDPAKDRSMSKYQVEHFRITSDDSNKIQDQEVQGASSEYVFDGTAYPDAPMLQLIDIHEGFLEEYIETSDLRESVDESDGWYTEKTIAVIRKVLRSELVSLRDGKGALSNEQKFGLLNELML